MNGCHIGGGQRVGEYGDVYAAVGQLNQFMGACFGGHKIRRHDQKTLFGFAQLLRQVIHNVAVCFAAVAQGFSWVV